jgi:hypothetical protein
MGAKTAVDLAMAGSLVSLTILMRLCLSLNKVSTGFLPIFGIGVLSSPCGRAEFSDRARER